MLKTEVKAKEDELRERLYPLVESRVFHVTRRENVLSILQNGGISPNRSGALPTTFGSSAQAYFRMRGCVSLFDLAHPTAEQIDSRLADCWPFQTAKPGSNIAIFIVSPEAYDSLIPWNGSRGEEAHGDMVVPYVETGYPGLLPIALIEELIEVEVQEAPDSIQAMHRRIAAEQAGDGTA